MSPQIKSNETESEYIKRCVPYVIENENLSQEQALGKCYGMYRNYKAKKNIEKSISILSNHISKLEQEEVRKQFQNELSDFVVKAKQDIQGLTATGISLMENIYLRCRKDKLESEKSYEVAKSIYNREYTKLERPDVLRSIEEVLKNIQQKIIHPHDGRGQGIGMPGGQRSGKNTEKCPDDDEGEGKGEGQGQGKNRIDKAKEVEGFESPEPGDLPKEGADLLAKIYAERRKEGDDKEKAAKIAWSAVEQAGYSSKKKVEKAWQVKSGKWHDYDKNGKVIEVDAPGKKEKQEEPEKEKNDKSSIITYRGESDTGGTGIAKLGRGIYSTTSKQHASKYGKVKEIKGGVPENPLKLNDMNDFDGWLIDQVVNKLKMKNIREFNKEYPDPGEYIRKLRYDGVQIGEGKDAIYVKYEKEKAGI